FEHGKSILNTPMPLDEFARARGLEAEEVRRTLKTARSMLFKVREERVRPGRDEKCLTAWNGLMLAAFAEAANLLNRDDYRQVAIRNGEFILQHLMQDGRLLRTWKGGEAKLNAYVEDYAYALEGFLALYEATFEVRYFNVAGDLADTMIARFWDEKQ